MNDWEFKELMERYERGETSLGEEKQLREYLREGRGDVPLLYRAPFEYYSLARKEGLGNRNFDGIVMARINKREYAYPAFRRRNWLMAGLSAAALILLLLIVWNKPLNYINTHTGQRDTFDDPHLALLETRKVLMKVSIAMNQGTEQLQRIAAFDGGIGKLQGFGHFETGYREMERIALFDQTRTMVIPKTKSHHED
ncbi:MAG: hypothetical protein JW861_13800 [Bacteroidales bacterium]|nr:hypothetical protein [Bacteroidales bacterium]